MRLAITMTIVLAIGTWTIHGQTPADSTVAAEDSATKSANGALAALLISQILLLSVVFVGLPLYSCLVGRKENDKNKPPLKGLNLPQGSVRSMLALAIAGSYLNVLIFGGEVIDQNFDKVLASFATLAGSVVGFYFGSRREQQNSETEKTSTGDDKPQALTRN